MNSSHDKCLNICHGFHTWFSKGAAQNYSGPWLTLPSFFFFLEKAKQLYSTRIFYFLTILCVREVDAGEKHGACYYRPEPE